MNALTPQIVNLFASALLLIAFAMLSQRRIVTLINLFAVQGLALVGSTVTVALATGRDPFCTRPPSPSVLRCWCCPTSFTGSSGA